MECNVIYRKGPKSLGFMKLLLFSVINMIVNKLKYIRNVTLFFYS